MAKHSRALAAWRQYRLYRLIFVTVFTVWMLTAWSALDISPSALDNYTAVLFLLDSVIFALGLFGFYLVFRRDFPIHLAFFGVLFPIYHMLLMKSDVLPAFMVAMVAFGDFYFNAFLPPGSLQKLVWSLWVQGQDEFAEN